MRWSRKSAPSTKQVGFKRRWLRCGPSPDAYDESASPLLLHSDTNSGNHLYPAHVADSLCLMFGPQQAACCADVPILCAARVLRGKIKSGKIGRLARMPASGLAAEYDVSVPITYAALGDARC
jgi:hypothetical protein